MKGNTKITLGTDMNTTKLQAKLKAIGTHAEALADKLESIDNAEFCEHCGRFMEEVHVWRCGELIETGYSCPQCKGDDKEWKQYTIIQY